MFDRIPHKIFGPGVFFVRKFSNDKFNFSPGAFKKVFNGQNLIKLLIFTTSSEKFLTWLKNLSAFVGSVNLLTVLQGQFAAAAFLLHKQS